MFKNMFKYWGVNPEPPVKPKVEPPVKPKVEPPAKHKWSKWEDTPDCKITTTTYSDMICGGRTTETHDGISKQRRRCTICNKIQRDDELKNKEATQCLN